MKLFFAGTRFHFQLLALLTALVITGCSKKEPPAAASASPSPQAATAAPTPPPTDAAQAPVGNVQNIADINAAMAAAEAANRARQYEEAAKTLLILQQQRQMSAQQAQALQQQMRDFQRNLATAVASGNAQAKAAAEMLRASASHH